MRQLLSAAELETYLERAYSEVLVPIGGAPLAAKLDFVLSHLDESYPASQWRLNGSLGFGGKAFVRDDLVINVSCALADRTPARESTCQEVNRALLALRTELLPNTPPAYPT